MLWIVWPKKRPQTEGEKSGQGAGPGFLVGTAAGFLVGRSTAEVSVTAERRRLNGATIRLVGVADPVVERAEDREPQLPRQRLHHPIGCEFGPDDWKERRAAAGSAADQEGMAGSAGQGAATATAAGAPDEVGAQEPVLPVLAPRPPRKR